MALKLERTPCPNTCVDWVLICSVKSRWLVFSSSMSQGPQYYCYCGAANSNKLVRTGMWWLPRDVMITRWWKDRRRRSKHRILKWARSWHAWQTEKAHRCEINCCVQGLRHYRQLASFDHESVKICKGVRECVENRCTSFVPCQISPFLIYALVACLMSGRYDLKPPCPWKLYVTSSVLAKQEVRSEISPSLQGWRGGRES